jgi:hypothetical protein
MFKFALAHQYDEEDQWAMKDAMTLAKAQGITVQNLKMPDGSIQKGTDNDLATTLFGNVEQLVRSHVDLADLLMWQVLQTAEVSYIDPRTQIKAELDWRDNDLTTYEHFPASGFRPGVRGVLDAFAPADNWSNVETANGIRDLWFAVKTYVNTNGFPPDSLVMSRNLRDYLLDQRTSKEAAASIWIPGGTSVAGTIGPDGLNEVLKRRGIPPIETFDERYQTDIAPGVNSADNLRFLADNRVVFLKEGMGERAMGTPLEGKGKAGIYQRTYEKTQVPILDVTETISINLPVAVQISKLGMSFQVDGIV